ASAVAMPAPILAEDVLQSEPKRMEIWDILLGTDATTISAKNFARIACGTNGGPASRILPDFGAYLQCRPEPDGLREVYFEYDDEFEYPALAHDAPELTSRLGGKKVLEFPAIVSLLINEASKVQGLRIVTDPRGADLQTRSGASALGQFLMARFGAEGWICEDLSPRDGYEPAGGIFID